MADNDEFNPIEYFQNPKEPAQRAGYSISTFQSLVSNFQNGKVEFFLKPQYGPNRRQASDFIHERIVSLRKSGHSVYEIKDVLSKEEFSTSIQTINRIIKDEGFAKLPRRTGEELGITKKNLLLPPISTAIDLDQIEGYRFECQHGGQRNDPFFHERVHITNENKIFTILSRGYHQPGFPLHTALRRKVRNG